MLAAVNSAKNFATGRSRADLDTDEMLLFALVRAIEIIGEAATKLSAEARAAAPEVPWTKISAMRNRLVHAYFHIDRDILWRTVTEEVPALPELLSPLLNQ